jgi:RimJ/RimL family protein N-acetyltransferase
MAQIARTPQQRRHFVLSNGLSVDVRPVSPTDGGALVRFHAHLSQRAVTMRYFYPHLELRPEEVVHLTTVDGCDRYALVVTVNGELIAIGRYDRLDDRTQAEVAFVVANAFQHQGLATMLLGRLAQRAREVGITCLVAEVLAENAAMLAVFHGAGFPIESSSEWGTIELKMSIVTPALAVDRAITPARSTASACLRRPSPAGQSCH